MFNNFHGSLKDGSNLSPKFLNFSIERDYQLLQKDYN